MFRAAVIGCGKIGSEFSDDPRQKNVYAHTHAYALCETTRLIAVCDADATRLASCAQRWNVKHAYCDANELLAAERPELVSICTPDETHVALIRAALETDGVRGILAEKPLALDVQAADQLIATANARGIVLAVNYSRRYADNHARLRERIENGGLGVLQAIHGYYTKGALHNGTHWFDLVRYLAGEVKCVWGFRSGGAPEDYLTPDAMLELASGVTATLRGLDSNAFTLFEMDIVGTKGRARILDSGHTIEYYRVAPSAFYSDYQMLTHTETDSVGMGDVTLHAVQDLVECVKTSKSPRCSAQDARDALAIGLAALESAQSGQPVAIKAAR